MVSRSALAKSMALATPLHAGLADKPGRSPEVCVSRWRSVTAPLPWISKPGIQRLTLSSRRSLPRSMSSMMDGVVAMTLVNDAPSKMVSAVIGRVTGSTDFAPNDF